MAVITWTNIREATDSLGVQLDRLKVALGAATETGSIRKAANASTVRLQTIAGSDAQAGGDLLGGSDEHRAVVTAGSVKCYNLLERDVRNLDNHLRLRGGANNTLDLQTTNNGLSVGNANDRISPSFAELYRALSGTLTPVNVYPVDLTALGHFLVSGSGAGTWTPDATAIDAALYGGAACKARCLTLIGAASINVTVNCINDLGNATTATCTITNGSAIDTLFALTLTAGTFIVSVTSVTITGGTAADDFRVETVKDRTPAE